MFSENGKGQQENWFKCICDKQKNWEISSVDLVQLNGKKNISSKSVQKKKNRFYDLSEILQ